MQKKKEHRRLTIDVTTVGSTEKERPHQRPANSEALQVAAEGPLLLLLLSGHQRALDEGVQLERQLSIVSHQKAQDLDAMLHVLLREEQQGPARRRSAV